MERSGPVSPGGDAPPPPPVAAGVMTGIGLTAGGYALFAIQDASVKWLVETYAVPQVLFLRSVVIMAVALAFGRRRAVLDLARSRRKSALLVRAGLILAAWLLYYTASRRMGLAELTTLYFSAPIMAVALAAMILKERVDASRWAAAVLGFCGTAIAAGPFGSMQAVPAASALAAAGCWAMSTILVRWIGRSDSTSTQMLASNGLFVLACLPSLLWFWKTPDAFGLALMLGLGLTSGIGQYMLFEGFRYAPASVVAPFEYTGLVWAFIYGYAIWGDVPHWQVFAGAALIAASSLGLIWSERRRAQRAAPA